MTDILTNGISLWYTIGMIEMKSDEYRRQDYEYMASERYRGYRLRNRLKGDYAIEIWGYEPYNNVDAILTGDNKRMMYWSLRETKEI